MSKCTRRLCNSYNTSRGPGSNLNTDGLDHEGKVMLVRVCRLTWLYQNEYLISEVVEELHISRTVTAQHLGFVPALAVKLGSHRKWTNWALGNDQPILLLVSLLSDFRYWNHL